MKYIVMECHPSFVVLLDSEGRFVKACNMNYETGQTVYEPVLINDDENMMDNIRKIDRRRKMIKHSLVAAVCVILIGFNFFRFFIEDYTSLYISINPEVRIDMNRIGTVTEIEGDNEDGKRLLEMCDIKSRDKLVLCREIIESAYKTGYVEKGGKVSVYIDTPDDEYFKDLGVILSEALAIFTDEEYSLDIDILSISQYVFSNPAEQTSLQESTESTDTQTEESTYVYPEHDDDDDDDDTDDDDNDDDDDDDEHDEHDEHDFHD